MKVQNTEKGVEPKSASTAYCCSIWFMFSNELHCTVMDQLSIHIAPSKATSCRKPETNWEKNMVPLKSRGILLLTSLKPYIFVQGRLEPSNHNISVLPLCHCCGWPQTLILSVRQCSCFLFASMPSSAERAKWEMCQPASLQMAF